MSRQIHSIRRWPLTDPRRREEMRYRTGRSPSEGARSRGPRQPSTSVGRRSTANDPFPRSGSADLPVPTGRAGDVRRRSCTRSGSIRLTAGIAVYLRVGNGAECRRPRRIQWPSASRRTNCRRRSGPFERRAACGDLGCGVTPSSTLPEAYSRRIAALADTSRRRTVDCKTA